MFFEQRFSLLKGFGVFLGSLKCSRSMYEMISWNRQTIDMRKDNLYMWDIFPTINIQAVYLLFLATCTNSSFLNLNLFPIIAMNTVELSVNRLHNTLRSAPTIVWFQRVIILSVFIRLFNLSLNMPEQKTLAQVCVHATNFTNQVSSLPHMKTCFAFDIHQRWILLNQTSPHTEFAWLLKNNIVTL